MPKSVQLGDTVLYRDESDREDYPAMVSRLRADGTADLHVFRPGLQLMPVQSCPRAPSDDESVREMWRPKPDSTLSPAFTLKPAEPLPPE